MVQTTTPDTVVPAPDRPPSRFWLIAGIIALIVVLLAVAVTVMLATADRAADRREGRDGRDHVVSGPVGDRDEATFELVSGVNAVTVRADGDLDDQLYRISTPEDSDLVPSVVVSGDRVQLHLAESGKRGPSAVEVRLNPRVLWRIRMTAGAATELVDLRGARVGGVEFIGGASSIELILPKPSGTVPVRMSGGAGQFTIRVPDGVPAQVRAGGGAGSVSTGGVTRTGVAGGTVVTPPGWDQATDRYDVDCTAGVSTVSVTTT